jgi:hypothetical protein
MCCNVSVSFPQNLQVGSPSNRPILCRCFLTGPCPVRIATTILSWRLFNLSRLSARYLHGPLIKILPCLWPAKFLQIQKCCFIVQALMASLTEHLGTPRADSGPCKGKPDACLASLSASSFPGMPQWPGTQARITSFRPARTERAFRHFATRFDVTLGPSSALSAAWLSEKIRIRHYGPGVDSASNRNEYQEYFLGVKAADAYGWQPCHLHVPTVLKSGSLNLLESSGPVKACNGIALTLP